MSERYVPPPPPYQPSIQKVTDRLEPSSRDEEWNDSKYSMVLTDKALKDAALHNTSKYPARLDGASFRTRPRPLPSRPVDPPGLQEHGYKRDAIKSHVARDDYSIKLRSTASMMFPAPSLDAPTHHLSSSVHPSQSSYDTPRRTLDDRRPVPAYSSMDFGAESRSSHASVQSPPHGPRKNNFRMRLSFDPSVAYSDSQANAPTTFSRWEAATSLYASAVSSHLLDYPATYASHQPYASMRSAPRSNETARRDNIDWQSLRSRPPDSMSSRTSLYTFRRPKTTSGYEGR